MTHDNEGVTFHPSAKRDLFMGRSAQQLRVGFTDSDVPGLLSSSSVPSYAPLRCTRRFLGRGPFSGFVQTAVIANLHSQFQIILWIICV